MPRLQLVNNLRDLARRRKALGIKPKKVRLRAIRLIYPSSIEREYQRKLTEIIQKLRSLVNKALIPQLPKIIDARNASLGINKDAWYDDIDDLLDTVDLEFGRTYTRQELEYIALVSGRNVSEYVRKGLETELERVLGINILASRPWQEELLNAFSKRNADLITSVKDQYLERIRDAAFSGVSQGTRWEDIRDMILGEGMIKRSLTEVAESRANLIARDQIGKLLGQTNQLEQQSLGITKYTWSTSLDERVRGNPDGKYPDAKPSHWAKEGKVFSWDDPPADTGHPGEDYQCRCSAIPVMEDLIDVTE